MLDMDALPNIMLRERSQTPKTSFCMIPFISSVRRVKCIVTEKRSVAVWELEVEVEMENDSK